MKAQDILADSLCWTQGTLARDKDGRPCDPSSDKAVQFCIRGALIRAYPRWEDRTLAFNAVYRLISPTIIEYWNDDPTRTFSDVRRILEIADV